MGTEYESLKIKVDLEQAGDPSAQLRGLGPELARLGQQIRAGTTEIGNFNRSLEQATRLTASYVQGLLGLGRAFEVLKLWVNPLALGVGVLGYEFVRGSQQLRRQAEQLQDIATLAKQAGISFGEYQNAARQFQAVGIGMDQAKASIAGLHNTIAQLARPWSELRTQLMENAGPAGAAMMEEWADRLVAARTEGERFSVAREGWENVYRNALAETNNEIEARNRAMLFMQDIGVDPSFMRWIREWSEMTEQQQRRAQNLATYSGQYAEKWGEIFRNIGLIRDIFESEALQPGGPLYSATEGLLGIVTKVLNVVERIDAILRRGSQGPANNPFGLLTSGVRGAAAGTNPFAAGLHAMGLGGAPLGTVPGAAGPPGQPALPQSIDVQRGTSSKQSNTSALRRLIDTVEDMLGGVLGGGGGRGGGGGGPGGGPGGPGGPGGTGVDGTDTTPPTPPEVPDYSFAPNPLSRTDVPLVGGGGDSSLPDPAQYSSTPIERQKSELQGGIYRSPAAATTTSTGKPGDPNTAGTMTTDGSSHVTMSFYNEPGGKTSSGEPFDPNAYAAAIPMRDRAKYGGVTGRGEARYADITDTTTGKTIRVRLNDVGGLPTGRGQQPRGIDVTPRVMQEFGGGGLRQNIVVTLLPPGKYTGGPVDHAGAGTSLDTPGAPPAAPAVPGAPGGPTVSGGTSGGAGATGVVTGPTTPALTDPALLEPKKVKTVPIGPEDYKPIVGYPSTGRFTPGIPLPSVPATSGTAPTTTALPKSDPTLAKLGASPLAHPGYYGGEVTVGGQTFHFGTGGLGRGSMPFGTFAIDFSAASGDVGRRIGAVAGLSDVGSGNVMQDPKYPGAPREGILIHTGSEASLDKLYTEGCFRVQRSEWPAFKAKLLEASKNAPGGKLWITVQPTPEGKVMANIGPAGNLPGVPSVANVVKAFPFKLGTPGVPDVPPFTKPGQQPNTTTPQPNKTPQQPNIANIGDLLKSRTPQQRIDEAFTDMFDDRKTMDRIAEGFTASGDALKKAKVTVDHENAPEGTKVSSTSSKDVDVSHTKTTTSDSTRAKTAAKDKATASPLELEGIKGNTIAVAKAA